MATRVRTSRRFNNEFKRLNRKYRNLIAVVVPLVARLGAGERPGDRLSGLGITAYKVRVENPAAGRGKGGGFRIVYLEYPSSEITLAAIYDKSEQADISNSEVQEIIAEELS